MLYSSPTRPPVVESTHEIGVALGYRLVVVVYQQSVVLLIRAGDLQVLFKPRYNLIERHFTNVVREMSPRIEVYLVNAFGEQARKAPLR